MKQLRHEGKIVLLGDASRHEVARQMEIAHGKQYSKEELYDCRPIVLKYACTSAKSIVAAMRTFDIFSESDGVWQAVKLVEDYTLDSVCPELDPGFAIALNSIRKSPLYTAVMERQAEFSVLEPAA